MDPLAIWYQQIELDELATLKQAQRRSAAKQLDEVRSSAARKNQLGALDKLTELADGRRRIRERPPLVVRLTPPDLEGELVRVASFFDTYLLTLPSDRARLLSRYSLADVALKVVGVGSVGTRCLVALFVSGDDDALFLQVKQATRSVLEPFLGATDSEPGQRVVDGQRLIQTAPDPFLGWGRYDGEFGSFSYYVRQLWDGKASVTIDELGRRSFADYAGLCGDASPGPTPARVTRPRSPAISVTPTRSTAPSSSSPSATPGSTDATSGRHGGRSTPARSRRHPTSEAARRRGRRPRPSSRSGHPRSRIENDGDQIGRSRRESDQMATLGRRRRRVVRVASPRASGSARRRARA